MEPRERLFDLRRDKSSGREKPYKPALLLAFFDLIERGEFPPDCVSLTDDLVRRYRDYLAVVGGEGDRAGIGYPFWHLAGDELWSLRDRAGNELYVRGRTASQSPSVRAIRKQLGRVAFDAGLSAHLREPLDRDPLREAVIGRYFSRRPGEGDEIREVHRAFFAEGRIAAEDAPAGMGPEAARSAAFARLVKRVYDYRCAAFGLCIRLRHGGREDAIVDACHLVPFHHSGNDHPSNGMALSKDDHWALDQHLISPSLEGAELRWRDSPSLDPFFKGHRQLLDLQNRVVLLPPERAFQPAPEAVRWRRERLLGAERS